MEQPVGLSVGEPIAQPIPRVARHSIAKNALSSAASVSIRRKPAASASRAATKRGFEQESEVILFDIPMILRIRKTFFTRLGGVKTLDQALSEFLKMQKGVGSYAALAEKIGISESTVFRLITGQQSATVTRVEQIMRALGKSPQEIFGEETARRRTRRG